MFSARNCRVNCKGAGAGSSNVTQLQTKAVSKPIIELFLHSPVFS